MQKFNLFPDTTKFPIILITVLTVVFFSCNNKPEEITYQQSIPNSDFENWEELSGVWEPSEWNTSNFNLYDIVSFTTVTKDSENAYSGNFCPRLETKSQLVSGETVKVVGLLTLGIFDINIATKEAVVYGGMPTQSKPVALEGYYKYSAVGIDSCFIDISLFTNQQDTVAKGRFSSSSKSEWTLFNIPLKYKSGNDPDNMNIIILSSDTSIFEAGSTLWVDKLSLKY